jgi:hypothetical protein
MVVGDDAAPRMDHPPHYLNLRPRAPPLSPSLPPPILSPPMQLNFLTEPVPHAEAIALLRDRPVVTREIFDSMGPEFTGRAFTITGIEVFDVLQAVRDQIATLPAGADWKKLRKEIAAKISPWLEEGEAKRRAELLLNHHGRAAYAAAWSRAIHAQGEVFTHLMYRSSRRSKDPRASHQALDGLILPRTHPFWETHTPPWEFGCNCLDPIPMTAEDAADEERENPGSVASREQLAALEKGTLVRGPGAVFNIQTPREKSGSGYEWSWRDTTLPYGEIRKRWSDEVAEAFEEWAEALEVQPGQTLRALLTGQATFREMRRAYRGPGQVREGLVEAAQRLSTFEPVAIGEAPVSARLMPDKRAALVDWEAEHARDGVEHGLLLDENGNEMGRKTGTRDSVPLPDGPAFRGIFSHSHPGRSSFSYQDVEVMYEARLGEVRVTTLQGTYSMSRKAGVSVDQVLGRMTEIADDVEASIASLGLSPGEIDRLLNHTVWDTLAREGLLNYQFTPMTPPPLPSADSAALSAKDEAPWVSWFVRDGWAALLERVRANPERYGEPTEAEDKAGRRLPKSEGGTL